MRAALRALAEPASAARLSAAARALGVRMRAESDGAAVACDMLERGAARDIAKMEVDEGLPGHEVPSVRAELSGEVVIGAGKVVTSTWELDIKRAGSMVLELRFLVAEPKLDIKLSLLRCRKGKGKGEVEAIKLHLPGLSGGAVGEEGQRVGGKNFAVQAWAPLGCPGFVRSPGKRSGSDNGSGCNDVLMLRWDNSFSWLRSKTVRFHLRVVSASS